jgi:hypothetical protein
MYDTQVQIRKPQNRQAQTVVLLRRQAFVDDVQRFMVRECKAAVKWHVTALKTRCPIHAFTR